MNQLLAFLHIETNIYHLTPFYCVYQITCSFFMFLVSNSYNE